MPVTFEFRGNVPNDELQWFYRSNRIDCFITTSETEGLPVSIMEAMSYGIPVIATDVGGIREMVDGNGILLSPDPDTEEVGNALLRVMLADGTTKAMFSEQSARVWDHKFNRKNNVKQFSNLIPNGGNGRIMFLTVNSVKGNWCFMKEELAELSEHFRIRLIETEADEEDARETEEMIADLNKGIEHFVYHEKRNVLESGALFLRFLFSTDTRKERREIFGDRKFIVRRLWESYKYYRAAEYFFSWFQSVFADLSTDNRHVFYSYWLQPCTLGMCIHKKQWDIYSRAHGYDLYNERFTKGLRQPFRKTMDPLLDGVLFISDAGQTYYNRHFSTGHSERYHTCYLGSTKVFDDHDKCPDEKSNHEVTLVSCSALIPLKRVRLIIDALHYVSGIRPDVDIRWIHFGDGPLRAELEQYAEERLAFNV